MKASLLLALLLVFLAASQEVSAGPNSGSKEDSSSTEVKKESLAAKPAPANAGKEQSKKDKKDKNDAPKEVAPKNEKNDKKDAPKEVVPKNNKKDNKEEKPKPKSVGQAPQAQVKHGRRDRRGIDGAQLALLSTLLHSQEASDSGCCDDSGKANTNDRLVDQINIVMAKLQNCRRNYYGYPYWNYPYPIAY